jgi:hypothetical protein
VAEELATQSQTFDEIAVPCVVNSTEIIKKTPPLPNEFQQPSAREMVLSVSFEVFRQLTNTLGQQRNLYFRGAGICSVAPKLIDSFAPAPNLLHAAHCFSLLICSRSS